MPLLSMASWLDDWAAAKSGTRRVAAFNGQGFADAPHFANVCGPIEHMARFRSADLDITPEDRCSSPKSQPSTLRHSPYWDPLEDDELCMGLPGSKRNKEGRRFLGHVQPPT